MAVVKSDIIKQLKKSYPNFLTKDLSKFTDIILNEIKNALKRGDRVVTKSGMHGKVLEVNDQNNTCVLETMAGKIKFDKTAISLEMSSKLKK